MKSFRTQIIAKAESLGLKKLDAEKLYNEILLIMCDIIKAKEFLMLRNFGTFRVRESRPRIITSKIINNGKPTATKSKKNVKFKASNKLKEYLNS